MLASMAMRFGAPRGVKDEYRSISENVLIAVSVLLFTAYLVLLGWRSTNDQAIPVSWWSLPVLGIGALIVIIRALRRGVFVTDFTLIERRLFLTRILPWTSVRNVSFSLSGERLEARVDGKKTTVRVRAKHMSTPFEVAVRRAIANSMVTRADRVRKPYPARGRRWITYALLASSAGLLIGVMVVEVAVRDRDVYRLRAARDVPGFAEVAGSHIDEDSDEGGTSYTTYVDVRIPVGERTVKTQLHRQGRWTYETKSQIAIVYDAKHPRDADFGDRVNRKANDSSVSLRLVVGRITTVLSALGVVVFGIIVLVNTATSRGRVGTEPRRVT